VSDGAGSHVKAEPVAQQRGDFAVRQPELLIEQHDQRDRLRPQMRARGAEGIARLQRMSPLDATATLTTAADMHLKTTHVRLHDRQIFLDLGRHARFGDATATVRTRVRKRNVNDLIEGGGGLTMTMATVAPTGATAGWPRIRLRRPFENGAACRLPARRAAPSSFFSHSFSRFNRSRASSDFSSSRRKRSISR